MAFDPNKFRQLAQQQGYKSKDIDAFITKQQERQATLQLGYEGVVDPAELAKTDPVTALKLTRGGVKAKPTAEQEKRINAQKDADRILTQLENLYFKGGQVTGLAAGRAKGFESLATGILGNYEQLQTYKGIRTSVRPKLARAMGDTGNFSLPEQEAAVKSLPTEFSTPQEAFAFFKATREKLGIGTSKRLSEIESKFNTQQTNPQSQQVTAPQPQQQGRGEISSLINLLSRGGAIESPLQKPIEDIFSFLSPRVSGVKKQIESGQMPSGDELLGAGGEYASNILPFLKGGNLALKLGGAGAIRGATTPNATLEQRGQSALAGGALGAILGGGGQILGRGKSILSGAAKNQAAITRNKIAEQTTKSLPTNKLLEEISRIAKNLPATASKASQETTGLTKDIKPLDLLEKIGFWGQAYKTSGEMKDTASATLYGALSRTGRSILEKEAPAIFKAHKLLQKEAALKSGIPNALKKILFYGGPTAGIIGSGMMINSALKGNR